MLISFDQFQKLISRLKDLQKKIKASFSGFDGYLVLDRGKYQIKIDPNIMDIVNEFPELIYPNDLGKRTISICKEIKSFTKKMEEGNSTELGKNLIKKKEELSLLIKEIQLDITGVKVEVRFETLNYEILRKMKASDLMNQPVGMMSDAWIKVIVCDLKDLLETSI